MLMQKSFLFAFLSAGFSCSQPKAEPGEINPISDDTGDVDSSIDPVAVSLDIGPCEGGTWGEIAQPSTTLHVAGEQADHQLDERLKTTGSPTHPFRHFAELLVFLSESNTSDATHIGLWPGQFALASDTLDILASRGLGLTACGPAETSLVPQTDTDAPILRITTAAPVQLQGLQLASNAIAPIIQIDGAADVSLSALTLVGGPLTRLIEASDTASLSISGSVLSGGHTGIWTTGGATSLKIVDSLITGSTMAGIWTTGGATSLQDVQVTNITGLPGLAEAVGGWGVMVSNGSFDGKGLLIDGAQGVGLFTGATTVTLSDIQVRNISTNAADTHGRGIHISGVLYESTSVEISDAVIEDVADAGLFIRNASSVSISNISINNVAPGLAPEADPAGDEETETVVTTGDGIVIVQRGWTTEHMDPTLVNVELTGSNHFSAIARAAIIVDASVLNLEMPEAMDAGLSVDGYSIYSQHCAILNWLDGDPGHSADTGAYDALPLSFDDEDMGL
jgi:hypothetical protein